MHALLPTRRERRRSISRGTTGFEQHFGVRLAWVDILSVVAFGAVVYLAVRDRRQVQLHARWIACTALLLLPPVFARLEQVLPFIHSFEQALHVAFGLTELIIIAPILDDLRQGQRRLPYPALLLVTVGAADRLHVHRARAGLDRVRALDRSAGARWVGRH